MKKYIMVAQNTFSEMLTYRLNFAMWRVRTVLALLTLYFLWQAVLPKGVSIDGYNQSLMLTYIVGTSLISSFVLSSKTVIIGAEIIKGNLSIYLLRPFNYFLYWFSRDIGDKAMNLVFSFFEITLIILILKPPLFLQTNPFYLLLAFIAALIALVMYFFINFLISLFGFWSQDIWAPRFIFSILLNFFAGGLFPLDMLPKPVFSAFSILPFQYLLYFPIKIYLGQISAPEIYKGIFISLIWSFIIWRILLFVWSIGLKSYTANGG